MRSKTLHTLQAGRGIAALSVVIYHVGVELGRDPRFWLQTFYSKLLGPGELGVEFFFVLSGIVIFLAHWRDIGVPAGFGQYLWKRFRRIYPIYWTVLLLPALALYLLPHFQPGVERSFSVVVSAFLLVHLGSLPTILIVAWTLFHEILFYAVFSLCVLNRRVGFAVLAVWLMGSLLPFFHLISNPGWVWFFSPLHLLFAMGIAVACIIRSQRTLPWRTLLVIGSLGLCAAIAGYYQVNRRTDGVSLAIGIAMAFLVLGAVELERTRRLKVWQPLNFLGNASYSIYLIHFPIISFTFRLLFSISGKASASLWLFAVLGTAMATFAGIILHLFVEIPLLRILSGFEGRRPTTSVLSPKLRVSSRS
jgi:exopolysaccharide production protein ExoZ